MGELYSRKNKKYPELDNQSINSSILPNNSKSLKSIIFTAILALIHTKFQNIFKQS